MTTILTPRLRLRPYLGADVPALVEGMGRQEVGRWMRHVSAHPCTEADARSWIERVAASERVGKQRNFVIALRKGNMLIGGVGVTHIDNAIGYWLNQDYWGRGMAHEALDAMLDYCFRKLYERRVCARTHPDNERSQRLLVRTGFRFVGAVPAPVDGWEDSGGPVQDGAPVSYRYEMTVGEYRAVRAKMPHVPDGDPSPISI